ncbi:MAG: heparinase II/III-family protein, partial [Actinobacteria bacterium]|nr:heparinase II/III-family protein [Actinomycetota bacterium]
DGKALVLDPSASRWEALLDAGRALVGSPEWWPPTRPGATSYLLAALAAKHPAHERPLKRPHHFDDAGLTILRGNTDDGAEVWCRCDSGPHGFLSIAAHGHADALSVEVRHAGVEILADPGTYCYHDEPEWRAYFRSTLGHNTLEVGGRDQSVAAGPFLWSAQANTKLISVEMTQDAEATSWSAEHDGYASLEPPVTHRRTVRLVKHPKRNGAIAGIEVLDELSLPGTNQTRVDQPLLLAFHFGPALEATLEDHRVYLTWQGPAGPQSATLVLPQSLSWRLAKGQTDPVLGWYSPSFGVKVPAWSVIGSGRGGAGTALRSELYFQRALFPK